MYSSCLSFYFLINSSSIITVKTPAVIKIYAPVKEGLARATYDYTAEAKDDLGFRAGEEIVLLEHVNKDWLRGRLRGKTGIFPITFVTITKDI